MPGFLWGVQIWVVWPPTIKDSLTLILPNLQGLAYICHLFVYNHFIFYHQTSLQPVVTQTMSIVNKNRALSLKMPVQTQSQLVHSQ